MLRLNCGFPLVPVLMNFALRFLLGFTLAGCSGFLLCFGWFGGLVTWAGLGWAGIGLVWLWSRWIYGLGLGFFCVCQR